MRLRLEDSTPATLGGIQQWVAGVEMRGTSIEAPSEAPDEMALRLGD